MQNYDTLARERFPLSSKYDRDWMLANSMGPNSVWLTEFLTEAMDLKPGMKILDMGCGRAMSSIFLAREFGVEVWANDLWIPAADNEARIREADLADQIHSVNAEAHALPYEKKFFDAIVSIDAYQYFGTDDLYLGYIATFLKDKGHIGIVCPSLVKEFDNDPPEHLRPDWFWDFAAFHSPDWWARHWDRIGKVDVLLADWLADGWKYWAHWDRAVEEARGFKGSTDMLEADAGRNFGFARVIAKLREKEKWQSF